MKIWIFVINTSKGYSVRKRLLKEYERKITEDLGLLGLKLNQDRSNKFDSYRLALFNFEYKSVINNSPQTIKIDISLKNPLQLPAVKRNIKSVYIDKVMEENLFGQHFINCIDLRESVAEKVRASLTRKVPAIRDFFDVWYIRHYSDFNFNDSIFRELVIIKLKEAGNKYCLEGNYDLLQKQVKKDLKPVLNDKFNFDLEEIWGFLREFE